MQLHAISNKNLLARRPLDPARRTANKVPEATVHFWIIKALTRYVAWPTGRPW
ncbi:hypothetical protein ACFUIY_24015 [Streptomyces griseorubiginosus]|uniref:hypothetical protein n=1 Tax=Streptomyces griseorubiginosus TaxID=67304 RepID=UPI003642B16F